MQVYFERSLHLARCSRSRSKVSPQTQQPHSPDTPLSQTPSQAPFSQLHHHHHNVTVALCLLSPRHCASGQPPPPRQKPHLHSAVRY